MGKKFFEDVSDRQLNKGVYWVEKNPYTGREVKLGRMNYTFEVWCEVQKLWCGILTPAGLLTAYGDEKTLKSTFLGLMMISFLTKKQEYQNMIRCNIDPRKIGLWVDSEIPRMRLLTYQNAYMKAAGYSAPPSNYRLLQLKRFDYKMKAAMFLKYINEYRHDLGFVAVDGFVDLLAGMNEEQQAKELMAEFDYYRETYQFSSVSLIHKNRNNKRTSGSAGSVLDKKSDYLAELNRADKKANAIITTSRNGTPEYFEKLEINFVNDLPSFM